MRQINPLRLLAKSLLLFLIGNLIFASTNPPVGRFSIFNHLIPGRLRFPAQTSSVDRFNNGDLTFEDLDAMFASHVVSTGKKPPNEYRVIFLGDSSIWGYTVQPSQILTEQINRLHLVTCDGRRIRAYDFAYPLPSYVRDLLILEKAVSYQPDLIVWPITLLSFQSRGADKSFLRYQADRTLDLVQNYGVKVEAARFLHRSTFWERTIVGQRSRLRVVLTEQLYGLLWAATGEDSEIHAGSGVSEDVQNPEPNYYSFQSVEDMNGFVASLDFSPLTVGSRMAGNTPILVFNEPIFRARGANSSVRYNKYYPRWAYDEYRIRLNSWMAKRGWNYTDLWDSIGNSEFTESPLHLTPAGERQLAGYLAPEILKAACP